MMAKVLMGSLSLVLFSTVSFAAGEAFSVQCQQAGNSNERLEAVIASGDLTQVVFINREGSQRLSVFKALEQKDPDHVDYRLGGAQSMSGLLVDQSVLAGQSGKIVSWVDALGYHSVDYVCGR